MCLSKCTCSLGAPIPPVHSSHLFVSHMNIMTAVRASQYGSAHHRTVNGLCNTYPFKENYSLRIASDDLKTSQQEAEMQ